MKRKKQKKKPPKQYFFKLNTLTIGMFGVWWSVLKLLPRPNGTRKAAIIILKQNYAFYTQNPLNSIRSCSADSYSLFYTYKSINTNTVVLSYLPFRQCTFYCWRWIHAPYIPACFMFFYSFIEQTFCIVLTILQNPFRIGLSLNRKQYQNVIIKSYLL